MVIAELCIGLKWYSMHQWTFNCILNPRPSKGGRHIGLDWTNTTLFSDLRQFPDTAT